MIKIKYEAPVPPEDLRSGMIEAATASVGFYIMLGLSTCLATLGLIANSAAVIIGAMIIAPLMNPIIACSFSLARGNLEIFVKSLFTIFTSVCMVLVISMTITWLMGYQLTGAEILARGNPNLIDLGVAVVSGIAGAIAWTRKKISNALPGVAMSIALVPPLCAAGIGLALGQSNMRDPLHSDLDEIASIEWGAMLLFLTNFSAILLFGGVVFLIQGYGLWKKSSLRLGAALALTAVLVVPLTTAFGKIRARSKVMAVLQEIAEENFDWQRAHLTKAQIQIDEHDDTMIVLLRVSALEGTIDQTDIDIMKAALSAAFQRDVEVELVLVEFTILSSSDTDEP